jgi:hypothetical protein
VRGAAWWRWVPGGRWAQSERRWAPPLDPPRPLPSRPRQDERDFEAAAAADTHSPLPAAGTPGPWLGPAWLGVAQPYPDGRSHILMVAAGAEGGPAQIPGGADTPHCCAPLRAPGKCRPALRSADRPSGARREAKGGAATRTCVRMMKTAPQSAYGTPYAAISNMPKRASSYFFAMVYRASCGALAGWGRWAGWAVLFAACS